MSTALIVIVVIVESCVTMAVSAWLGLRQRRRQREASVLVLAAPRVGLMLTAMFLWTMLLTALGIYLAVKAGRGPQGTILRMLLDSGWLAIIGGGVWSTGFFIGIPLLTSRVLSPQALVRLDGKSLRWRGAIGHGQIDVEHPFELRRHVAQMAVSLEARVKVPHMVVQVIQGETIFCYRFEWSYPESDRDPLPAGLLQGLDVGDGRALTERLQALAGDT